MSEPERTSSEAIEGALRKFAAAPADGEVRLRIAAALAEAPVGPHRVPWGDRMLQYAVTLGAAAAVVIVTLQSLDAVDARHQPASPPLANAPQTQVSEFLAALAAGKDPIDSSSAPR